MKLKFSKMHGLGNDFIVLNGIEQNIQLSAGQIQALGDRHFGIGFDQLLLVEKAEQNDVDFRYRIFNNDGAEVEHCGNGARCFARYVRERGLTDKNTIRVVTENGIIILQVRADGQVTVDMGAPRLAPAQVPFLAEQQADLYPLQIGAQEYLLSVLSMGNPHAVLQVTDVDTAAVAELGIEIQNHPRFPASVNVGFMQVLAPNRFRLRVFERGVGETLACGTGACAAMVAGRLQGLLQARAVVELRGGELELEWSGQDSAVMMTGSATQVFDGEIEI